jgi:beta-glucosidase
MSALSHSGDEPRARRFPEGFLWGTGTSSYQIEGAVATDGRGPSIWDVYAHTPGNVFRGDTGDIACDSYNRVDDDVRMVQELGVGAYRFSVSWPRVQPTGSGAVNQAGLDYYRRLAERLRESGVQPVVTVYHWDLPQALEDQGGWANRDTAQRMAELALLLGAELADQVSMWITVNEPLQTVHQGYRIGTHAPGRCDDALAAAANHHILLGHGLVLQALRQSTGAGTLVGPTMDPHPYVALDADSEAVAASLDAEFNRAYLDPVLHGRYPGGARPQMLPSEALIHDGDMELIGAPIDFLGVNYFVEYQAPGQERTVMDWPVEPASLRDLLLRLHGETDGLPLYITENGCAADDYVSPDGTIDDYERIAYIHGHLDAAADAIADGVNLAGYFHWSLMDNFEWAHGYRRRFGLHYVDFETGRRVPKRSAGFYGSVARTGHLPSWEEVFPLDGPPAAAPAAPAAV